MTDYRASGVDIDAGNETVRRIKTLARATFTSGVLSEIGSFGGLFWLECRAYLQPVLVSSADGVGTKLKVASTTSWFREHRPCFFSTTSRPAASRPTSPNR